MVKLSLWKHSAMALSKIRTCSGGVRFFVSLFGSGGRCAVGFVSGRGRFSSCSLRHCHAMFRTVQKATTEMVSSAVVGYADMASVLGVTVGDPRTMAVRLASVAM